LIFVVHEVGRSIVSGLLGLFALTHCTGARDPLSSRVETLEQRVAELERGNTPGAVAELGPDAGVDASPEFETDAAIWDAQHWASPPWDAGTCWDDARAACLGRLVEVGGRPGLPRYDAGAGRDAPLVWRRQIELDSPEGQRCLREERERCEHAKRLDRDQAALREKRERDYFRWLDDQLSPARVDTKLSQQVEARTAQALRQDGGADAKVKVSCVREFCRIEIEFDPEREHLHNAAYQGIDWPIVSLEARQDPGNPRRFVLYVARSGWVLPMRPFRGPRPGTRFRTP
jgi:hypothetical protein